MDDFWWYATRSSGIVATLLAVASLVWGFFFSSRNTGGRRKPNWWLDLHNNLGGLALIFTGVHVVTAFFDSNAGIGIAQVFVPGTGHSLAWAVSWGVLAMYLFALTVFSSWPKKRFSRRVWRIVHLTSVAAVVFALLHAYQLGSDAQRGVFQAGIVVVSAFGVYALCVRLLGLALRRTRD
ncbi:MAG: Ferric reductase like transrane component [Ilumatobacteraceae bacterium]|nr:Ferric reductase like transrane component [Ilumatobacteraceae bacterium]